MSANDFYSSGDNSYRQAPQQSQQQQQQYYDPNVPEGERGILGATVGSVGGAVATYKYTNGSFWKSAAGAVAGGIALSKIEDEYKARKQNGSNHGNGFNFGSHAAAGGGSGGAGGFSNFLGGKRDMDGGSRGVEGYGAPPPYPPSQHHHQQDQYSGYNSSGSAYPGMNQYAPPPPPPPGPYGAPGYGAPGYGSPGQGAPHGNGNGYNNW